MSVTIKQISKLCGVSRGTVDRVLNNRGKVKPETEQKIRNMAEQLGYRPILAGKVLAAQKKEMVIGILLVSEGNAFFDDVKSGILCAQEELKGLGVKILLRTVKGYYTEQIIHVIEEIREEINALILTPVNDPAISEEIDSLVENHIGVFTINTDIENSKRICYIGSDYIKGGETACGMMGLLTGGKANLGIITGSVKVLGHNQRISGFRNIMKKRYPDFKVLDFAECNDDDDRAFQVTKKMLKENPSIDAIFIVAAGVSGVCKAVQEQNLSKQINIICFDSTPASRKMMEIGLIKVIICQQPFRQGNRAVHVAFEYLMGTKKESIESIMIENEIRIRENI